MYIWKNSAFNFASGNLAKFKDGCSTYDENFIFQWRCTFKQVIFFNYVYVFVEIL